MKEIKSLLDQPEKSPSILENIFQRERKFFIERQSALRDLREKILGSKDSYFHERVAYSIKGLDQVAAQLKQGHEIENKELSYLRFHEWQSQSDSKFFMIGEMIWQSCFYLVGANKSLVGDRVERFMSIFAKSCHGVWPEFDSHPPKQIDIEDLGEFFASNEIIIDLRFSFQDASLNLVLPYQSLLPLEKKSE